MKKMICLVSALLLALSLVFCVSAEGKTFTTSYYTLELPAGWDFSTDPLDDEADGDMQYLGAFGENDGLFLVYSFLTQYEELKDVSLWNADEEMLQNYSQSVLEDFSDKNPELIGTVQAGSIPFVLIRCRDEDGEFIYADTMTNGYAIIFQAVLTDENVEVLYPFTEENIETFRNILSTFRPVT